MSRIGKQIIEIPAKTEVTLVDGLFTVKGPKGELSRELKSDIVVTIADGKITLKPVRNSLENNSLWGTYGSLISNMITGVNTPFVKKLILEGIGFKAEVAGVNVNLALGFSHPVKMTIPAGVTVTSEKGTITITGPDKEVVGQFAASMRALKKPEPYKGKGFHYSDEIVKRKQGKKTV